MSRKEQNRASLERQVEQQPENPSCLAELGWTYAREGRLFKAVSVLRRAWRASPSASAAERLAACLVRLGRSRGALGLLNDALSRWPGHAALYRIRGEAALTQGMAAHAAADYTVFLRLHGAAPGDEPCGEQHLFGAWYGLGVAQAQLHRWTAAIAALGKALAASPCSAPAASALVGAHIAQSGRQEALRMVSQQVGGNPNTAGLFARAFAAQGCWQEALLLLRHAVGTPANMLLAAEAHLMLGDLPVTLGALETVEAQLKALGGAVPRQCSRRMRRQVRILRLFAAWLTGDHGTAARLRTAYHLPTYLQVFQCCLHDRGFRPRLSRGERQGIIALLERLLACGQLELAARALELLEVACGADPAGGPPLSAGERRRLATIVGRLLARYGQLGMARGWLPAALQGDPTDGLLVPAHVAPNGRRGQVQGQPVRLLVLGEVHLAVGEPMQAAGVFRRLVQSEPDNPEGRLGLAAALLEQARRLHPTKGPVLQRLCEEVAGERRRTSARCQDMVYERPNPLGGGTHGRLAH